MFRRTIDTLTAVIATLVVLLPMAAFAAEITVYKSPYCGCCGAWVTHMKANGHTVKTVEMEDLTAIKKMTGVGEHLQSCHTAVVDGYVIEGHVPAADVARLLTERPKARGLSVPGMPEGSPGMDGPNPRPYEVLLFQADGSATVYARHN
ncbi:MAG: metal-binding protein [Rhodospirillales bacterium CG15_BIG_FIL_POST_REV_8_21_14_020_66_15]|nr:MAG: metal-binding protein [Rhodospirillales bacterium CG15_BIG_FIL_POST_REV_8_21_14_020_66_15]